jgi:transcriptional regulator with XRE-family HTH domain
MAQGLSLAEFGASVGYSASQLSRYERGIAPLTDIIVLRRFATALGLPPQVFGLSPADGQEAARHAVFTEHRPGGARGHNVDHERRREDGDDVRRRQLLASIGLTAAAAVGAQVTGPQAPVPVLDEAGPGELFVTRVRGGALGRRVDPGVVQDLPHGGGGDLDAEHEEFAVDAPVAPAWVLSCQAQYHKADGADGARSARAPGAGDGRVAACQQVPVPAQHCLGPGQQPEPAEHVPREAVQQGGQERPVAGQEARPVSTAGSCPAAVPAP